MASHSMPQVAVGSTKPPFSIVKQLFLYSAISRHF
jgi:hypothetical protein